MRASVGPEEASRLFVHAATLPANEELRTPLASLPSDFYGDCESEIMDVPAALASQIAMPPTGVPVWLVTDQRVCRVELGEPRLLVGASGWVCGLVLAYELTTTCDGSLQDGSLAPFAFLNEPAPSLRWVRAGAQPATFHDAGSNVQIESGSVRTPLPKPPELSQWEDAISQNTASLVGRGAALAVGTGAERIEQRWAGWFVFGGNAPQSVRCSCRADDAPAGCTTSFDEWTESTIGLVRHEQWTEFADIRGFLRGGLIDGERVTAFVTGYFRQTAIHIRAEAGGFDMGERASPFAVHEEDSERTPVDQAPYCGP